MECRRLGNSGLKVSKLCLGAMMFGERTDEAVASRIADAGLHRSEIPGSGARFEERVADGGG
jgi:hypothetical protein